MPHDQNSDTIADLQRSLETTLTYIMGRASVAELYGIQAHLSQLASRMAPVHAARFDALEMPDVLRQQMAEIERQTALMRAQHGQANCTPAAYRQEG